MKTATPEKSVRILIVDDHELMRRGLRDLIHTHADWQVCGEAAGENDAFKQFRDSAADLVIVDLSLENGNGLDLIVRLKQANPAVPILVLSMHDEELYAERVFRAGADGFVNKQRPSRSVLDAIGTVLEGGVYASEEVASMLLDRARGAPTEREPLPIELLSDRELQVFRLIGQGLSTENIAQALHISVSTVGTYRERVKSKLNVPSSAKLISLAVSWAIENG